MMDEKIVRKIEECYVGEDCVQVELPYVETLSVFSKEGMLFHDEGDADFYVNQYMEEERRHQFPYSNIPIVHTKKYGQEMTYINQLFQFNQSYLIVQDQKIKECYVVKDTKNAYMLTRDIEGYVNEVEMPREEFIEFVKSSLIDNNQEIILWNGKTTSFSEKELIVRSEKQRLEDIKESLKKLCEVLRDDSQIRSKISSYLLPFPQFFQLLEQCLQKADLKDLEFDIPILNDEQVLFCKCNGEETSITKLEMAYVQENRYRVTKLKYETTDYPLEEIKYLMGPIEEPEKIPISLILNPNVTKQELKEEENRVKQYYKNKSRLRKYWNGLKEKQSQKSE